MLFSSITFLYGFLPLTLLVYYLTPRAGKNTVLLLFSLVFYGFGGWSYLPLLLVSVLSGWVHGLLIARFQGRWQAKLFLVTGLSVSLGLLGYYKYADFLLSAVNGLFGTRLPMLYLTLPLGISFFTFQTISYVIDVYCGDEPAQRDPLALGLYICLFPQLVAGPIVRYGQVAKELRSRTVTLEGVSVGVRRFVCGLGKKVLLANGLGELCSIFRQTDEKSVLFYWIYAVAFSLQIYFDFSGYSDMAIGMGRMFGFDFPENFNYPFLSRSISEFWRCWHMTLGRWFRDYVYIPMGGNRVSPLKWVRNIAVVWLLTGLWHGAAWNFVLWGGLFGALLLLERAGAGRLLDKLGGWAHLPILLVLAVSFVLFNGDGLSGALSDTAGLFGLGGVPAVTGLTLYYLRSYAGLLLAAAVGATPLCKRAYDRLAEGAWKTLLEPLVLAGLLLLCTASLVDGSFNPFLYFRF